MLTNWAHQSVTTLLRYNSVTDMKGYTYILQVRDGRYYVGSTDNIDRRLAEHQRGNRKGFEKGYSLLLNRKSYEYFNYIKTTVLRTRNSK